MDMPPIILNTLERVLLAGQQHDFELVSSSGNLWSIRTCYWADVCQTGNWQVVNDRAVVPAKPGYPFVWLRADPNGTPELGVEGLGFILDVQSMRPYSSDKAARWLETEFGSDETNVFFGELAADQLSSAVPKVRTVLLPLLQGTAATWGSKPQAKPVEILHGQFAASGTVVMFYRRAAWEPFAHFPLPGGAAEKADWMGEVVDRALSHQGVTEFQLFTGNWAIKAFRLADKSWKISKVVTAPYLLDGVVWFRLGPGPVDDQEWTKVGRDGIGYSKDSRYARLMLPDCQTVYNSAVVTDPMAKAFIPVIQLLDALTRKGTKRPAGVGLPADAWQTLTQLRYAMAKGRTLNQFHFQAKT